MSTKKPTILLANDYPEMLELFSRVLEIEGCRVVTTDNKATVLKLTAKRKRLALVILQFERTAQQSIQVCRDIREFSDVPVIILAAKYDDYDIPRSFEAGAEDFIPKPISMVEFVARVKAVLRRRGFPVKFNMPT